MSKGKFFNRFGAWLLQKPLHSGVICLLAALLALVPLPGCYIVACTIIAFVSCASGILAGLGVIAWLLIPIIAKVVLRQYGIDLGMEAGLLIAALAVWLQVVIFRWQRDWVVSFWILTVVACLLMLALHIFVPNLSNIWLRVITNELALLKSSGIMPADAGVRAKLIEILPWFTSFMVAMAFIFVSMFAYFGQVWQAVVQNKDLYLAQNLRLTKSVWLLVATLVAAFFIDPKSLQDLLAVCCIPAILVGFFIWNGSARRNGFGFVFLILILSYIAFIFFPASVCLFWVATALLDTIFDVRAVLTKQSKKISKA